MIVFLAFQSTNCSQDTFAQYKSLEWSSKTTQEYDYSKTEELVSVDRQHNQLLAPAQPAQYSKDSSGSGIVRTQVTFKPAPGDKTKVIKVTETWTSRQSQDSSQSQNSAAKPQDAAKKSREDDDDKAQKSDESSSSDDATVEDAKQDDSYLPSLSSTGGKALALGTAALVGTLFYAGYNHFKTPTGDGSEGLGDQHSRDKSGVYKKHCDVQRYAAKYHLDWNGWEFIGEVNFMNFCYGNKDEFEKFKSFIKDKYKDKYKDGMPFWWKDNYVFQHYAQEEKTTLNQNNGRKPRANPKANPKANYQEKKRTDQSISRSTGIMRTNNNRFKKLSLSEESQLERKLKASAKTYWDNQQDSESLMYSSESASDSDSDNDSNDGFQNLSVNVLERPVSNSANSRSSSTLIEVPKKSARLESKVPMRRRRGAVEESSDLLVLPSGVREKLQEIENFNARYEKFMTLPSAERSRIIKEEGPGEFREGYFNHFEYWKNYILNSNSRKDTSRNLDEEFEAYLDQENQKHLQAQPASASRSASSNSQPEGQSLMHSPSNQGGAPYRMSEKETAQHERKRDRAEEGSFCTYISTDKKR